VVPAGQRERGKLKARRQMRREEMRRGVRLGKSCRKNFERAGSW